VAAAPRDSTHVIGSFADLNVWLKRFMLRVHPDVLHSYGEDAVTTNEKCLQFLLSVCEHLRTACAHAADPDAPPPPAGSKLQAGRLEFYYLAGDGAEARELRQAVAEFSPSSTHEDRMSVSATMRRGAVLSGTCRHLAAGTGAACTSAQQ
jgi:hypothetical protein